MPSRAAGFGPALERALAGTGPAVLPLPGTPVEAGAAVAAGRVDLPVDASIAVVVTTSGSTGDAKGVELSREALLASAHAALARLGGGGQWLLALDPRFVGGLQVLVRSAVAGTTPEVLDLDGGFRPADFAAATERLTGARRYTSLVPTQLRRLLDAGGAAVGALRSYDAILLGAAAATPGLLEESAAAGARVVTTYGMSETCGGCVYDGRPLADVTWTLDGGRIVLRGPVLAAGYRGRPELTAQSFVDGGFRTQDAGEAGTDGRLRVLGRLDDIVVSGGVNVSAHAVEAVLLGAGVATCAVLGWPDRAWGARVEAWIVQRDGSPVTDDELATAVRSALGREAVPRRFHRLDALPHLASGKVDRQGLRARAGRVER